MNQPSISLRCESTTLKTQVETALGKQGLLMTRHGQVTVIVDSPQATALIGFENNPVRKAVFITENPCGEYWQDVLGLGLEGFIAGQTSTDEIIMAVHTVHAGQRFVKHPPFKSALTPQERRILRQVANGLEDTQICERFGIKNSVVRNYVSTIMSKLRPTHPEMRLTSRLDLSLYYWGLWQVLRIPNHDIRHMPDVTSQV